MTSCLINLVSSYTISLFSQKRPTQRDSFTAVYTKLCFPATNSQIKKKLNRVIQPHQIEIVIDAFFREAQKQLANGNTVTIRDFVTFVPCDAEQTNKYDINTNRVVAVPGRKRIQTIRAKQFREKINATEDSF